MRDILDVGAFGDLLPSDSVSAEPLVSTQSLSRTSSSTTTTTAGVGGAGSVGVLTPITGATADTASVASHVVAAGMQPRQRPPHTAAVATELFLVKCQLYNFKKKQWEEKRALCDTGSQASAVRPDYFGHPRKRAPVAVRGLQATSSPTSTEGRALLKFGSSAVVDVGCLKLQPGMAVFGADLLLGAVACKTLGLISAPLNSPTATTGTLPELECLADIRLIEACLGKVNTDGSISPPESATLGGESNATPEEASIYLADAVVGEVLSKMKGDPFPDDVFSLNDIKFAVNASEAEIAGKPWLESGGNLTLQEAEKLRKIVHKRAAAFAKSKFPKPNHREPVEVTMKPRNQWPRKRPVHVPPPKLRPNERRVLNAFRERGERLGQLVQDDSSEWATYAHLVTKTNSEGVVTALRPTENDRPLNACVIPEPYDMPIGPEELRKASAPASFIMATDVNAAFNGFRIHENSQSYFVIWLPTGPNPEDGVAKYKNTRLGFGYRNSPSIMMSYYDSMRSTMQAATRRLIAAFYDDWVLRSSKTANRDADFDEFCAALDDFLLRVIAFGVELSPQKTVFGRKINTFYGFKFDGSGRCFLAERNVEAIRLLAHPTGVTELKSALGLFTQYRDWVKDFSHISAPLHALTSNAARKVPWADLWTEKPRAAFEELKEALATATANYAPDYQHPFSVEADASDLAIGGRIFQRIDGVDRNIAYFSRALSPAERKLPVYFRELVAMVEGIKRSRIYAHSSPFPLRVFTDQRSLAFTAQVTKGTLSAHHLAQVLDVDFKVEYVPGPDNQADFWSRYSYSRPDLPLRGGLDEAAFVLLRTLGSAVVGAWRKIWLYAGADTTGLKQLILRSRSSDGGKLTVAVGAPSDKMYSAEVDFVVLVPEPTQAPGVCARLLQLGRPAAVLVPTDVLRAVAQDHDGYYRPEVHQLLCAAPKVVLSATTQCWVFVGVPDINTVVVCVGRIFDSFADLTRRSLEAEPVAYPVLTGSAAGSRGASGSGAAVAAARRSASGVPGAVGTEPGVAGGSQSADGSGTAAAGAPIGDGFDRLSSRELELRLRDYGQTTGGKKSAKLRRLRDAVRAQSRRRRQFDMQEARGVIDRDLVFFDDPADRDRGPLREQEHIIVQLRDQVGQAKDWVSEQKAIDCPEQNRAWDADKVLHYNPLDGTGMKVVVPERRRERLMQMVHVELGHNTAALLGEIKKLYYWKSMVADVRAFLSRCRVCATNKKRVVRFHGLARARRYYAPRERYSMDVKVVGSGLEATYALGIVDRFSSFATVVQLREKTTSEVVAALMVHIVYRFGPIAEISIDSERAFDSAQFKAWAGRNGITVVPPLGYNSTSNSAVERFWLFFNFALSELPTIPPISERQQHLSRIAHTWNIQKRDTTGFTPFEIQHGCPATTAAVLAARGLQLAEPSEQDKRDYLRCHQASAAAIRRIAASRGNLARRKAAISHNRKSRARLAPLEVGTQVFYYQPPSGAVVRARGGGKNRAFVANFVGPATVVARLSEVGYVAEDARSRARVYRHRQHLRPIPFGQH